MDYSPSVFYRQDLYLLPKIFEFIQFGDSAGAWGRIQNQPRMPTDVSVL